MNAQVHSEIKIDRNGNGGAINAQIISLLHLVDETGSIPEACDMARMDLLPAWNMLVQAEDALGFPLFQYVQHKSCLTEKARKLMDPSISRYRKALLTITISRALVLFPT